MALYRIYIKRSAQKELRQLPLKARKSLIGLIGRLEHGPRPKGVEKLRGFKSLYRLRQSDYRVVYEVEDKELAVIVIKVAHRKDIYRKL